MNSRGVMSSIANPPLVEVWVPARDESGVVWALTLVTFRLIRHEGPAGNAPTVFTVMSDWRGRARVRLLCNATYAYRLHDDQWQEFKTGDEPASTRH